MKNLSEFKDEQAIAVVADLLPVIMDILSNPENAKMEGEESAFKMFCTFFKNSAKDMMKVFAILSETPVEEYHCNGIQVMQNIMKLVADKDLTSLFTSQSQTGDATSSGSASESTEAL